LVEKTKILLPPLHIKLGLTKNFVKGMDKEGKGFAYLKQKFPQVSDAKIKEGIFVGPQTRALFGDSVFTEKLNKFKNRAWRAFENVCKNFFRQCKITKLYGDRGRIAGCIHSTGIKNVS
jgi:hypothetical protein